MSCKPLCNLPEVFHVLQDLNVLQANAWVYWQAIENSEVGNFWGLIQARRPGLPHQRTLTGDPVGGFP